jgi:hypothetical protein
MESARTRIWISWAFAAVGALIGVAAGQGEHASALLTTLIGAYIAWALYWGVPPVWRKWCGLFRNVGCIVFTTPMAWLLLLLFFFYIPLVGGYLYGTLGGAIYEFLKCRRLAMGMSPTFVFSRQGEPGLEELMAEAEARRSYSASVTGENEQQNRPGESAQQEGGFPWGSEMTPEEARSVLGVTLTASREDIRAAFREQMKKYHPDRVAHLGDEFREIADQKSKAINKAYEILSTYQGT